MQATAAGWVFRFDLESECALCVDREGQRPAHQTQLVKRPHPEIGSTGVHVVQVLPRPCATAVEPWQQVARVELRPSSDRIGKLNRRLRQAEVPIGRDPAQPVHLEAIQTGSTFREICRRKIHGVIEPAALGIGQIVGPVWRRVADVVWPQQFEFRSWVGRQHECPDGVDVTLELPGEERNVGA